MNYNPTRFYHYTRKLSVFLLFSAIMFSCTKENDKVQNEYLLDAELIDNVSSSQVLTIASLLPVIHDVVATKQLLDVKVYKITYRTKDVDQNEITASGALLVPVSAQPLPVMSYQHGTLVDYNGAPSLYQTGLEARGLATIFSSAGYIISVPDYIGYGVTQNMEHPYEHAPSLATASHDMLMAVKEFIHNNNILINDKLFLTGYSEGGTATMALHKYIEEKSDLQVTLSAPAAGAYNKTAFAMDVLQRNENLTFLPNFMWVIHAYNKFYKLNRSWSDFVNEPHAATLSAVAHPFRYSSAAITKNPQELFTTAFKDGILNGTDIAFVNVLADNDIFDWKPKAPVRLYYGTADDYVFPLNSETAYEAMKARGADVTKVALYGLNHSSAFMPYILDVFNQFESLK
jgi:pimeloyl-ACP methyl ester carboxylesterase